MLTLPKTYEGMIRVTETSNENMSLLLLKLDYNHELEATNESEDTTAKVLSAKAGIKKNNQFKLGQKTTNFQNCSRKKHIKKNAL